MLPLSQVAGHDEDIIIKIQTKLNLVRINLPLFCYNNERPTGQKQQLFDGKTVENKGKLILTEIFPSVQKHDI